MPDPLSNSSFIAAPAASRAVAPARHSAPSAPPRAVRGRYDAAKTTDENRRHWAEADYLSARSANSAAVRKILRSRARYESENNSYARGMVLTLANDLIGAGPRLQMQSGDEAVDGRIEAAFAAWALKVKLAKRLRTMVQSKLVDGEGFLFLESDPALGDVQLDLRLFEADQVATPFNAPLDPHAVDGITFDDRMKPLEYHLLRAHPGDDLHFGLGFDFDRIPARHVIHWFREDRPGQYRGVPELTPALPLFAQLRRYTLATLTAAELAAELAATLETDMPPDGTADPAMPFETLDIERGLMTVSPAGWHMKQFKPEQPITSYSMFKMEILDEAARAILLPHGIATGNSAGYNYASGRLDHQTYYRCLGVIQSECEAECLDHILAEWLIEAAMTTDLVPGGADRAGGWPHCWLWAGLEHVDPLKEANAQRIRLQSLTTTWTDECQRDGEDPETRARKIAADVERFDRLGIPNPYLAPATAAAPATDQPDSPEDGGDNADPSTGPDAQGRRNGHTQQGLVHGRGLDRP